MAKTAKKKSTAGRGHVGKQSKTVTIKNRA
jgi:hypothetical protein